MTTNNKPCYPGCFYYTDSCFRDDCKQKLFEVEKQDYSLELFTQEDSTEFKLFKDD